MKLPLVKKSKGLTKPAHDRLANLKDGDEEKFDLLLKGKEDDGGLNDPPCRIMDAREIESLLEAALGT